NLRVVLFLAAICCAIPCPTSFGAGVTRKSTTLSQARYNFFGTAVGQKAFFGGGSVASWSFSTRVDIYNEATNAWSTAELSQAREQAAATSVAGKAFFAGGLGGSFSSPLLSNVVDIYNSASNTWSTGS